MYFKQSLNKGWIFLFQFFDAVSSGPFELFIRDKMVAEQAYTKV
jgi:hypothetical protein